jgi:CubicO group peptidase (beta-lactamase class C family)
VHASRGPWQYDTGLPLSNDAPMRPLPIRRFALALPLLAAACASAAPAASAGPELEARMDSLAPALLAELDVAGAAVGVVEGGRVAFTRAWGVEDRASGRPMTTGTLFNFASVSKPVTAWGVLRLVDQGALSLDAPVNGSLRRWRMPASTFGEEGVTVRRLLSHTAGISMPTPPFFPDTARPALEQVLRGEIGDRGPVVVQVAPGSRWMYSGGGYAILELMVEEAAGMPFAEYMRRALFQPLGMERTTFAPAAVVGPGIATPYNQLGELIDPYRLGVASAGGMYSSVEDFARLVALYARRGRGVLRPETFEAMLAPVAEVQLEGLDVAGARWGLGHGVHRTRGGERIVYHSGGNPGYVTYFLVMPERGIGMVIASNGDADDGVPLITALLRLWGEHYGVELQPIF